MKRTEIYYHKTKDGMIQIDGFKNVANHYQISKEFGIDIENIYVDGVPKYLQTGNYSFPEDHPIVISLKDPDCWDIEIYKNSIFTPEEFDKIIKTMKAAGKRLKKIVESEYEIKMVKI